MAPAKRLLSTTKELLIRFTFKGGYFCLFYLFFFFFSFREAKLPCFLFFSFLSHFISFLFFPPFFPLSFSFNCIRQIPGQYQYHADPQLYVQRIGPVVGSFHCTRRHATSGDALFRWPAGFGFGRCLSCILPVADPFLFFLHTVSCVASIQASQVTGSTCVSCVSLFSFDTTTETETTSLRNVDTIT